MCQVDGDRIAGDTHSHHIQMSVDDTEHRADVIIRPATLDDLPQLTEIHNYYVVNSHATFDLHPVSAVQRTTWFHDHSDGRRHRILVAEDPPGTITGYTATGRFRARQAYDPTVEVTIQCRPDATGRGIGTALYRALFNALATEDVHLVVAGIAQPNQASNVLHESFGFTTVGTFVEVGRKFDRYWDVRWMAKAISR